MNFEIRIGKQVLVLTHKSSVDDVSQALGKPVSDECDWAERYVKYQVGEAVADLTWSKRTFFGRPFERLEEVWVELK